MYPAFGPDPQAVINSQIGDDYDVFIGILWSRFDTRTPRAESGTSEEFERAYARLKSGEHKPEIMVYFKEAPLSPSKIDPAQIAKIQQFKESISARGGIYGGFEDSASFQSSVRAHLSAIIQKFAAKSGHELHSGVAQSEIVMRTAVTENEDLGYLDFTERYHVAMSELANVLNEMNSATMNMGRQLSDRNEEIAKIKQPLIDNTSIRRIVRITAENMEAYAKILEHKIPLFSNFASTGMNSLSSALALQGDFAVKLEDLTILSRKRQP